MALSLAVGALSGCAAGDTADEDVASVSGAAAAPAASAGASRDPEQGRKFAACMRENGVPDFPDPDADGRIMMRRQRGAEVDEQKMQAAMQTCRELAPNGGQRRQLDAAQQEQLRQFAQCMRDNGVDMPDPDPNQGGFGMGNGGVRIDRDSPLFDKAMEACEDKLTFMRGGDR